MLTTYPDLFIGYTVFWVILAAYLFSIGTRLRKLEKKVQDQEKGSNDRTTT